MTRDALEKICALIAHDKQANEAMVLLATAAKMEYSRERVANAQHRSALKAARKILDANERVDKETRNSLLGLVEVDE